jgi:hypothetical protein
MADWISSLAPTGYEQVPATEKASGPRWIKHHFRDLGFTDSYVEDLSDLAIDVNGDGYPDIVNLFLLDETTQLVAKPRQNRTAMARTRHGAKVPRWNLPF